MIMKRGRDSLETLIQDLDVAKCLMLFSQTVPEHFEIQFPSTKSQSSFECKTCKRKFSSFQALGGHRASHKRPKIVGEKAANEQKQHQDSESARPSSKQIHECSICGERFGLGQALGGHMRRHRAAMASRDAVPLLKRSDSCKRVFSLDLNLTPLENDLEFVFGKNLVPMLGPSFIH